MTSCNTEQLIGRGGSYVLYPGRVCDNCHGTQFIHGRATAQCATCGMGFVLPIEHQKIYKPSVAAAPQPRLVRAWRAFLRAVESVIEAVRYARSTAPAPAPAEPPLRTLASWHRWEDGSWNRRPRICE